MRPPGGSTNRGAVLPTLPAVDESERKYPLGELRASLQELTALLASPGDREVPTTREEPPAEATDWATGDAKLGLFFAQRAEGDRSQNWELAIAAFEGALSGLTKERNPEEWAEAHMHLGIAYRDRAAGDKSDNQERAIRAFNHCLSVWMRERH